jgi:hypothetical protein
MLLERLQGEGADNIQANLDRRNRRRSYLLRPVEGGMTDSAVSDFGRIAR